MDKTDRRVFILVMDSFGIGAMPDAAKWGDQNSNTLGAIRNLSEFDCPILEKLGLFNIQGVGGGVLSPLASYARMKEASQGKDTTIGHWEIAGLISREPLPTFKDGFPAEIIRKFERETGRKVLCNKPYSGTEVIKDYGAEHIKTGALIVYTSADSVFQIAAHEDVVPVSELYGYCETARRILDKYHVGRVIARPFAGEYPYVRTANRHDFSLVPPKDTMLNLIERSGLEVIAVGKINDIFAGSGVTKSFRTKGNDEGMEVTLRIMKQNFNGLCFVNLVDFDSSYGHRNDPEGYACAATKFDIKLGEIIEKLRSDDLVIVTADHGCDPSTASTDHSREYTPMLAYGRRIKSVNLGTRSTFADISATVLDYLGVPKGDTAGKSFLRSITLGETYHGKR